MAGHGLLISYLFILLFRIFRCGELNNLIDEDVLSPQAYVFWPNATVPFYVDTDHFDKEQTLSILTALAQFAFKTCIKFNPVMAPPEDADHVLVLENPSATRKCIVDTSPHSVEVPHHVTVGYDCLKPPHIDMLIMKALGFPFEHNRAVRDLYIQVQPENVDPAYLELFTKDLRLPIEMRSIPYDLNSVMHFGQRDYSKNGHRTIIFKNRAFRQERFSLSPLDLRKIDIVYGPECRKRDRQEKIEVCQNYPGVARRRREASTVRSLRVNPDITPPPNIGDDKIHPRAENDSDIENHSQNDGYTHQVVRELAIEKEVEDIVEQVHKVAAVALQKARERYCNGTKEALRSAPEMRKPSNKNIFDIIGAIADYAQGLVEKATKNLTEFCAESTSIDDYQRSACPFFNSVKCRQSYKSTKSGAVKFSTNHRPLIIQSTKHDRITKNVFDSQYLRDGQQDDSAKETPTESTVASDATEAMAVNESESNKRVKREKKTYPTERPNNDLLRANTRIVAPKKGVFAPRYRATNDTNTTEAKETSAAPTETTKNRRKREDEDGRRYIIEDRPNLRQRPQGFGSPPDRQDTENDWDRDRRLGPAPLDETRGDRDRFDYDDRGPNMKTMQKQSSEAAGTYERNHYKIPEESPYYAEKFTNVNSNESPRSDKGSGHFREENGDGGSFERPDRDKDSYGKPLDDKESYGRPAREKDTYEKPLSAYRETNDKHSDKGPYRGPEDKASYGRHDADKDTYGHLNRGRGINEDKASDERPVEREKGSIEKSFGDKASHEKPNRDDRLYEKTITRTKESFEIFNREIGPYKKPGDRDKGSFEKSYVERGPYGRPSRDKPSNEEFDREKRPYERPRISNKGSYETDQRPVERPNNEEKDFDKKPYEEEGKPEETQHHDGRGPYVKPFKGIQKFADRPNKEDKGSYEKPNNEEKRFDKIPISDDKGFDGRPFGGERPDHSRLKGKDDFEDKTHGRGSPNSDFDENAKAEMKKHDEDDEAPKTNIEKPKSIILKANPGSVPQTIRLKPPSQPEGRLRLKGKETMNRPIPPLKKTSDYLPKTIPLSKKNQEFYNERLWPDNIVRYAIHDSGDFDIADVRARLEEVNKILEKSTCVKIEEITEEQGELYEDYLLLDNSPDYVTGRVGGKQNFGVIELLRGGQHRQHAAMMVMAMLGFYFEVSRHDRDKHIRVHMRHVRPDKLHHFEKIRDDATFDLPYDYKSATHPAWQFWRQIGKTGISTVATYKEMDPDGVIMKSLGQHEELLSESDLIKINSVYGIECFTGETKVAKVSKGVRDEVERDEEGIKEGEAQEDADQESVEEIVQE